MGRKHEVWITLIGNQSLILINEQLDVWFLLSDHRNGGGVSFVLQLYSFLLKLFTKTCIGVAKTRQKN